MILLNGYMKMKNIWLCNLYISWISFLNTKKNWDTEIEMDEEDEILDYGEDYENDNLLCWRYWRLHNLDKRLKIFIWSCMNQNMLIIKLDNEIHLGWWIWIYCNIKLDTLYFETERGLISSFYINSDLFSDEAFMLETNKEIYEKVLLNFSSSVSYWLYKWWCMNLLLIIFSYFVDRISDFKNNSYLFLFLIYFIMKKSVNYDYFWCFIYIFNIKNINL